MKKRKIVRPGTVKAALVLSLSMLSAGIVVQNVFFMVFGSITGVVFLVVYAVIKYRSSQDKRSS